jgi:hypothetical protein
MAVEALLMLAVALLMVAVAFGQGYASCGDDAG